MIETCIDHLLKDAKNKNKIKEVPKNSIGKIKEIKNLFKKNEEFLKTIDFFMMLRKLESLETERIGEFRKNVALKIQFRGKEQNINLEQLKIYAEMLEKFIDTTKKTLLKK